MTAQVFGFWIVFTLWLVLTARAELRKARRREGRLYRKGRR